MQFRTKHRLGGLAIAAALATGLAVVAAPVASAARGDAVTIDNTLPNWLPRAQPSFARMAAPSAMDVRVYLAPNGGLAALQSRVASLSDPESAEYRNWLSVDAYNAAYAPTEATVDSVSSYLTGEGLTITGVESHHRYIAASGTTDRLEQAFGVTLGSYTHDGQSVTAPSSAVTLPADVGSSVLTVSGLDTTVTKVEHDHATPDVPPPAGFANARPCNITYGAVQAKYQADYKTPLPTFQGQYPPYSLCGYTGPQFRAAYENNSKLDGAGVTVAITDGYRWQNIASDTNTYAVNHGDGAYTAGQLTENFPDSYNSEEFCGPSGWSGEETLDVEAVHAMAPAANIRYYAAASCLDVDLQDALARVVDENAAQLVTNSWGDVEANATGDRVARYEQIFLQGAIQGISFIFSSGDSGDELAKGGIKQANYPTSDPYATSVGGTSTGIVSGGMLLFQSGWGTQKYALSPDQKSWTPLGYLYGAGGGFSALFNRPDYQNGVVPVSSPAGRAVPDVAMDADPNTGMLIGQTQTFSDGVHYGEYRIGGTSLASPLFAGMTALALQHGGGAGLGLLNPKLYQSKGSITDVRQTPMQLGVVRTDYANGVDPSGGLLYSVRTFGQDSSLDVTAGWDPVTGIGVPNATYLGSVKPSTTASPAAPSPSGGNPQHGTPQR